MTTSSGDATELTFVVDARGLVREKRGSKWRRTYEFDDAGTLERETFHEQRDGYSWDEAFWYRETRFDGGSKTETFRRVGDGGWSLSATRTTWVEREGRRFRTLVDDDEESLEDFDDQGRPVLRSSPHGRATFSYDDAGQLARLRLGNEVHQFFYDDAGTRMREVSGLGLTVWTIAADGLPTRQRSTTGFDSMEYRYDTHRHLVERVRDTGVTFSYEYDEERVGVWLETAPWCVRRQPSR